MGGISAIFAMLLIVCLAFGILTGLSAMIRIQRMKKNADRHFAIGIFRTLRWAKSDFFPICVTNVRELWVTRLSSLSWHRTWNDVILGRRFLFLFFRRRWLTRFFARIFQINDIRSWTDWIYKLWIVSHHLCILRDREIANTERWTIRENIIWSTNEVRPVDIRRKIVRLFNWRRADAIRIVSLILDDRGHTSPSRVADRNVWSSLF